MNTITIPLELTEQQAAEAMGLSVHTLRTFRSRGTGIPYVKRGTRVSYRKEDIDEYLIGKYIVPQKKEKKNVADHPVRVVYPTAGCIDSE
jgi:predicted site-specific integrase-resolvase